MKRIAWLIFVSVLLELSGCGLLRDGGDSNPPGSDPNSLPPSAKGGGYYRRNPRTKNWDWYPLEKTKLEIETPREREPVAVGPVK